jgi:hypothetical protein
VAEGVTSGVAPGSGGAGREEGERGSSAWKKKKRERERR